MKDNISSYIDDFFNLSTQDNLKIATNFINEKSELQISSPHLKYDVLKYCIDKFPDLEISAKGLSLLEKRGIKKETIYQSDERAFLNSLISTNSIESKTPVGYTSKISNCVFIHEFSNEIKPDDKMLLDNGKCQLHMILSTNCDISTSTHLLNRGRCTEMDYTRSRIGVIISEGVATTGSAMDSYSYMNSSGNRITEKAGKKMIDIFKSVMRRPKNSYNEITVKSPQIAGLYFNFDAERKNEDSTINKFFYPYVLHYMLKSLNDYKKIDEIDKEMPIFAIIDGEVREFNINFEKIEDFCVINDSGVAVSFSGINNEEVDEKIEKWKSLKQEEIFDVLGIGNIIKQDELYLNGKQNNLSIEDRKKLFDVVKNKIKKEEVRIFYEDKFEQEFNLLQSKNKFKNKLLQAINSIPKDINNNFKLCSNKKT